LGSSSSVVAFREEVSGTEPDNKTTKTPVTSIVIPRHRERYSSRSMAA